MPAVLKFLYRHTLNSVPFGISLMALTAAYIAIGSGLPQVREHFEMDEILFFNWWPLKLLMALLVINLSVVTVTRIPLTLPRYGVWTIHLGIILLILSTGAYYARKVEGLALVRLGGSTGVFFDRWERALYVTIDEKQNFRPTQAVPLPSLPRFHDYTQKLGNASYLDRAELRGIEPMVRTLDQSGDTPRFAWTPLSKTLRLESPLSIDVVEYYPYAEVSDDWRTDQPDGRPGLLFSRVDGVTDPNVRVPAGLASWDDLEGQAFVGVTEIQHRHEKTQADVDLVVAAAKRLHKLTVKVGDGAAIELALEPGGAAEVGQTGYLVTLEAFIKDWRAIDGAEVPAVSLMVTRANAPEGQPKQFRRMVLLGRDTQTDFLLGAPGAGPMGKRQDAPLDAALNVTYAFADPIGLFPRLGSVKQVLLTSDENGRLTRVRVDATSGVQVDAWDDGQGAFFADTADHPPMSVLMGAVEDGHDHSSHRVPLSVKRAASLSWSQAVREVPRDKRNRNEASAGLHQLVKLRLKSGSWSDEVLVPFTQYGTTESRPTSRAVAVPGADAKLRFTLSTTIRPMPVQVALEKFTAVPYAGAPVRAESVMRDFRSDLRLTDENGKSWTASASLNSPAFLEKVLPSIIPNESWILYQAQWDPRGQRYTVLGVANRPAVGVMAFSCVMIAAGLLYAFYAKPVIIKRMKRRAIAEAKARKAQRGEAVVSHA